MEEQVGQLSYRCIFRIVLFLVFVWGFVPVTRASFLPVLGGPTVNQDKFPNSTIVTNSGTGLGTELFSFDNGGSSSTGQRAIWWNASGWGELPVLGTDLSGNSNTSVSGDHKNNAAVGFSDK